MAKLRECGSFIETNEKITFTFGGWDGKSYNGEPCTKNIWRDTNYHGKDKKFVVTYLPKYKVYMFHEINEVRFHDVSNLPTCDVVAEFDKNLMEEQDTKLWKSRRPNLF